MIGLMFVAAIGLWLLFTAYLTAKLPCWLGLQGAATWLARLLLVPLLLVGPLADHLIGMRQFERLCAEEGRLQISAAAAQTKRAKKLSGDFVHLRGYAIPIQEMDSRLIDLDTGEQIAQLRYFSTPGGLVGKLPQLGSEFTCSAAQRGHPDAKVFRELINRVDLTYGELK